MMALEQKYKVAYNSLMQLILNQYQNENNTTNDINFDEKLQNAKVSQIKIEEAQLNQIVQENEFFLHLYKEINEIITPQG